MWFYHKRGDGDATLRGFIMRGDGDTTTIFVSNLNFGQTDTGEIVTNGQKLLLNKIKGIKSQ